MRFHLAALVTPVVILLAVAGCAGPAGTPDTEIGLSKASVFDTPSPEAVVENTRELGESELIPRAHTEAPPVIPHGVTDLLPIRRDENMCVDCHMTDEKTEGGPTPIPASHYIDLRNAPTEQREIIAGARFVCVTCHMERTEAAPLVTNRFKD